MLRKTTDEELQILMIAPQPFFRPRGTPFSVLHRVRALTELGHRVHLICYPLGEDVQMPRLTIERSPRVPGVKDVPIGPSLGKIMLDLPLMYATLRALRTGKYDVLHSHEEAAFWCVPLAKHYRVKHIYDMHSSLPQQLRNFGAFNLGLFRRMFESLEHYALRGSQGIITICQDLADIALKVAPRTPHAMIENTGDDTNVFQVADGNVRERWDLTDRQIVLYTGTLEAYQGLDLLLQGFGSVVARVPKAHLLIVGGTPEQVEALRAQAAHLGIAANLTFTGQIHPAQIPSHIAASDVIVSPRSRGTNTPLKIYGYLRSLKPIVATDLPTHTQTLNSSVSELVSPTPEGIAAGLIRVLEDPQYGRQLATAASELAERGYSDAAYLQRVRDFMAAVSRAAARVAAVVACALIEPASFSNLPLLLA